MLFKVILSVDLYIVWEIVLVDFFYGIGVYVLLLDIL